MGEIKSAFEKAMERTKGVAADKASFEANKNKTEGKKIISVYLDEPKNTLEGCFEKFDKKQQEAVKKGMFEALSANLKLPLDDFQLNKNMKVMKGFYTLIADKEILDTVSAQLEKFFKEYLEQRDNVTESLEQQFAPRLRQKEQEIAEKMGSSVTLEASQDPEFIGYLKKSLAQLDERYKEILTQVKDELTNQFKGA